MSDFYEILGVARDASASDIAKAYRDLSLQHHPQLSKEPFGIAYKKFSLVSQAYQVLSDKRTRESYNRYGEFNLNQGVFKDGKLKFSYVFNGQPERIFEQFFGSVSPFTQIFDPSLKMPIGSLLGFTFDATQYDQIAEPVDCVVEVPCTLKELYNGCSKKVKYQRNVLGIDGQTTKLITEEKEIEILPGFSNSHSIDFPEQGNQAAGVKTSSLIFKIKETSDISFKRKGDDLIYPVKITLRDALLSTPIFIQTLDGRQLNISIDEVISPQSVKIIPGEGMPIFESQAFDVDRYGQPPSKGNLILKFEINIPSQIDVEKKDRIIEILQESFEQQKNLDL